MEARRLIENARYDPSQLKALAEAFDRAWERIAPSFGTRSADMGGRSPSTRRHHSQLCHEGRLRLRLAGRHCRADHGNPLV